MNLKESIIKLSSEFPDKIKEERDGILKLEFKVAERKVFLSHKTLMYKARMRVDDDKKEVRFFEILKEKGLGISSGDATDIAPGLDFKKETYKVTGKGREGTIEELSKLFGKEYKYSVDYATVRKKIEKESKNAGYTFSICLREGSV